MLQLLTLMVSFKRYRDFFKSGEYTYRVQTDSNSAFKNLTRRRDSFQKLTTFSQGTMYYMLQLLTEMVFFGEIHLFLQLN
jgi:hypothetical protein